MKIINFLRNSTLASLTIFLVSCSTIEDTVDSTWDSIESAGDYLYDSVKFWEDEEPEQSEAIVIEEAIEVPEYAMPDESYFMEQEPQFPIQSQQLQQTQQYFDPIYRSARQYYFVGPNGTPLLAPPPPPFPQYSIDQAQPLPYSYSNNFNPYSPNFLIPQNQPVIKQNKTNNIQPQKKLPRMLSQEEEMELYGIQNNCIRVVMDNVNGGYMCDDFD